MSQRLYKAKADHNNEWVCGYYLEVDGVPFILPEGKPLNAIVQVKPDTVCQQTGHKDKCGADVYEDDILKSNRFAGIRAPFYVCGKDVWHVREGGVQFRDWMSNEFLSCSEVIGNMSDMDKWERLSMQSVFAPCAKCGLSPEEDDIWFMDGKPVIKHYCLNDEIVTVCADNEYDRFSLYKKWNEQQERERGQD